MKPHTEERVKRLKELKKERNAVILAHNYQIADVQDVADFVGDSFELSRKAAKTDADVIVFCGVRFMAESAKILSPDKKVLLPVEDAGCPLAEMANVESIRKMKERYPDAEVVTYVNSTAAVKAESYVCCTSSNAVDIVKSIPSQRVIFLPDKNLGHYVSLHTDKDLIIWDGYCPTHDTVKVEDVKKIKEKYPEAVVMIHPECPPDVVEMADFIGSTAGMLRFAKETDANILIVGTEEGMIHRLEVENPNKKFIPLKSHFVCPNMKKITLEKVVESLEDMKYEIDIPEETRKKAYTALDRMLKITK